MALLPVNKPRPDLLAKAIAGRPEDRPEPGRMQTYSAPTPSAPKSSPGLKLPFATDKQALNASLIGAMVGSGQLSASQVQKNAQTQGVDLAKTFGNNAVSGVYRPTAVATPAPQAPAAQATPAQAPAVAPQPAAYRYQGPLVNPGTEAQARAAVNANYQTAAAQQALARRMAQLKQSEQAIEQQRARGALEATEAANATGFGTSGRNYALNAGVNAAAVREQGALEAQRNLAQTEAGDALARIAREQGMTEVSLLGELSRDARDYGLQEALANANLAQSAFSLSRGQQMLPYELQQAQLGLQQGQFNLGRDQQLLGGQLTAQQLANALAQQSLRTGDAQYADQYGGGIGQQMRQEALLSAIIGNMTGRAQYQDQWTPGGFGYQGREQALRGQTIANEIATIDKGIKELELQIAQNPDYGASAQAREKLADLQAARQAKLQEVGSGGLTAAQEYNRLQDRIQDQTRSYGVSSDAATAWLDFQDAVGDQLSMLNPQTANVQFEQFLKQYPLSARDKQYLWTRFWNGLGVNTPNRPLESFTKDYEQQ